MSERWVISDTHFSHRGILTYEKDHRPFDSLEEHDEMLVHNWNSVVKPDDKVFHVGDFCLNRAALKFAPRLMGRKILIMGNHDTFRTEEYLEAGFTRVCGALQVENLILTHIPVHPQQLEHRFFANVHGHLHSHIIPDWRYLNVSCEQINLTPITLEEVYSRIVENQKKQGKHYHANI
jgi:calcineurin-like phosphoesterase family protein